MTVCMSTYTIDRRTGEKLSCGLEQHDPIHIWGRDRTRHVAHYRGLDWTWTTDEQDRPRNVA